MAARASVYHTSSYKSSVELKAILQRDIGLSKMSYKFYHRGVLGDTPTVPEGIEVRAVLIVYLPDPILSPSSDKP